MKLLVLLVIAVASAENFNFENVTNWEDHPVLGYHAKVGIPLANEIRMAEESGQQGRIVGGIASVLGHIPFHVGIVIDLVSSPQSVCSGVLLNTLRVLTAAHCWWNRQHQAWRFTLVAGSTTLYTGGQRRIGASVTMHGDFDPDRNINNIAFAIPPTAIVASASIAFARLPIGDELEEHFAGTIGTVSGYGITADGGTIPNNAILRYVNQHIISNSDCRRYFPYSIDEKMICSTGGQNFGSPCDGDAGGPITVTRGAIRILVGIMSFRHPYGCGHGYPVAYTRVTHYNDWIRRFV